MNTEKLVMHIIPASAWYDPNSGTSFDVQLFCLDENDQLDYMRISLTKPEIYGLQDSFTCSMKSIIEKWLIKGSTNHHIDITHFLIRENNLFGTTKFSIETGKFEDTIYDIEKSNKIKEQLWDYLFTKRLVTPTSFDNNCSELYENYGGLDDCAARSDYNI